MKKKLMSVLLAGAMAASLVACGSTTTDTTTTSDNTQTQTETTTETPAAETTDSASTVAPGVEFYSKKTVQTGSLWTPRSSPLVPMKGRFR